MKDAESHAEEDKKRKEEIETRNRADQTVYAAEKMLQEMGSKLDQADNSAVTSAIESLKQAIAANDIAGMTRAMEQLTQAQHKAAENLYKQSGAGGPGAGSQAAGGPGPESSAAGGAAQGDVIDAEVVEEEKK
jgi:molecular chaperone DnaK